MAEETKKTYTIRLPENVAAQLDTEAESMNITPTTLVQAIIVRHVQGANKGATDPAPLAALGGKLATLTKACERLEQTEAERYAQLLFEVVKTRSAIFHSLDQTMGANAVDEVIEAAEQSARQYLARLDGAPGAKQ